MNDPRPFVNRKTADATRQLDCQGCGNALSVQSPRANYISCPYCGSVSDLHSEEHRILMSMPKPEDYKPWSFIRLGMVVDFEGQPYQVIARTRWRQDYQEYYDEEGERGYSKEVWYYDEWLMISKERTYFYLVEDQDGYCISDEIIPDQPSLPQTLNQRWAFMKAHSPQTIQEMGKAEVVYFEGETNYKVKPGDEIRFVAYLKARETYTVEWRKDEGTGETKEIEFFRETPIPRARVMAMFGANEELKTLESKRRHWGFMIRAAFGMAFLSFLLLLRSCGGGEQVFHQNFDMARFSNSSAVVTGDFALEKGLHSLLLRGNVETENSEAFTVAYILDADSQVINTLDGDFSYYTGYDDEGHWSERESNSSTTVRVDSAGVFHARILANSDHPYGDISFTVKKEAMLSRYFAMSLFLFLFFALIFWGVRSNFK